MKKVVILFIILFSVCACVDIKFDNSYGNIYNNEEKTFIESENDNTEVVSSSIKSIKDGDTLRVHYLDVGQADSIFLELPNSECMLIDAGESKSSNDIISYIENLGYNKINYVIGTHPHADHIGGLAKVIETFDIGTIYMPKVAATSKTYENLLTTIASKNLKIKTGKAGIDIINTESFKMSIISPIRDSYSGYNNYSIVLRIIYGNTSFLFMGDAEELAEKDLTGDISADVLKVGHHGSDTSSSAEFLDKVNPKYAVISVGENNSYKHPAATTLEKLSEYTSNVYRTDINGTIIISSDGNNYSVNLEKGE